MLTIPNFNTNDVFKGPKGEVIKAEFEGIRRYGALALSVVNQKIQKRLNELPEDVAGLVLARISEFERIYHASEQRMKVAHPYEVKYNYASFLSPQEIAFRQDNNIPIDQPFSDFSTPIINFMTPMRRQLDAIYYSMVNGKTFLTPFGSFKMFKLRKLGLSILALIITLPFMMYADKIHSSTMQDWIVFFQSGVFYAIWFKYIPKSYR